MKGDKQRRIGGPSRSWSRQNQFWTRCWLMKCRSPNSCESRCKNPPLFSRLRCCFVLTHPNHSTVPFFSLGLSLLTTRPTYSFHLVSLKMKASVASLAFALSGTALAFPFSPISAPASFSSTGIPKPSQTSVDVPLPNPFAPSSTSVSLPSVTPSVTPSSVPVIGGQPAEFSSVKRGDIPIPTGFSSLASEAESALGALASLAPQKRAGSPLPTGLSSLASEAESALSALESLAPQKRGFTFQPLPPPTVTPSGVASGFPTTAPISTPLGISSSLPTPTSVPLVVPTGFAPFGFPLA